MGSILLGSRQSVAITDDMLAFVTTVRIPWLEKTSSSLLSNHRGRVYSSFQRIRRAEYEKGGKKEMFQFIMHGVQR